MAIFFEIKILIKEIDKDGDGIINRDEFAQVFLSDGSEWTQEEVDDLLLIVDTDGDGAISYEEFVDWSMGNEDELAAEHDLVAIAVQDTKQDWMGPYPTAQTHEDSRFYLFYTLYL